MKDLPAVRLNADEVMKTLYGEHLGDRHEAVFSAAMQYLCAKALEISGCGINVILDCGFWQRKLRRSARDFLLEHGVSAEVHYVHVSDEIWRKNIEKRNLHALEAGSLDYYIDQSILAKFSDLSNEPTADEVDEWIENRW